MTQTHQGWSNYATWAVNLWVSNDYGLYLQKQELVSGVVHDCAGEGTRYKLADAIEGWVTRMAPEPTAHTLWSDLQSWAIEQVDWHELATEWLADGGES